MQSLWMLVASFLFACMGVCVKLAAATHTAAEIVFYRSFVSLLLMFALIRLRGVSLATPHWRWQLSRGVVGFLALSAYFWAISLLPLATAVTLNYTSAIFLALLLALTGWSDNRGMMLSLVAGFMGVIMLLQPSFGSDQWLGGLIGLGSGMLAAMAYFSVRQLGRLGEMESRTVFYFSLVASVCSLLWLLFSEVRPVGIADGLLLVGTAIFATLAQLAMTRAYARGQTLMAATLAYSTVIFSSIFGMLIWEEQLTSLAWAAMLMIVFSGIAATYFSSSRQN